MKPFYTIRKLMYDKYGEERYAIACEIVSRWLKFETRLDVYTAEWVQQICNTQVEAVFRLPAQAAEALRRLFGLQTVDELITKNGSTT